MGLKWCVTDDPEKYESCSTHYSGFAFLFLWGCIEGFALAILLQLFWWARVNLRSWLHDFWPTSSGPLPRYSGRVGHNFFPQHWEGWQRWKHRSELWDVGSMACEQCLNTSLMIVMYLPYRDARQLFKAGFIWEAQSWSSGQSMRLISRLRIIFSSNRGIPIWAGMLFFLFPMKRGAARSHNSWQIGWL